MSHAGSCTGGCRCACRRRGRGSRRGRLSRDHGTQGAAGAWRDGDAFIVEFDLPGVNADSVDLDVERNVLTVHAERPALDQDREMVSAERPRGVFSRQLFLGENLDTDQIQASYQDGVLRLSIPVAEKAKPRRIAITNSHEAMSNSREKEAINA